MDNHGDHTYPADCAAGHCPPELGQTCGQPDLGRGGDFLTSRVAQSQPAAKASLTIISIRLGDEDDFGRSFIMRVVFLGDGKLRAKIAAYRINVYTA